MGYHWPGNIRELKNVIERSIILRKDARLQPSKLLLRSNGQACETSPVAAQPLQTANQISGLGMPQSVAPLKAVEQSHIQHVLNALSNNHSRTAKALGISRSTLMRKIKAYGLAP
jgi:DNA-binding NtrC family response regulator